MLSIALPEHAPGGASFFAQGTVQRLDKAARQFYNVYKTNMSEMLIYKVLVYNTF